MASILPEVLEILACPVPECRGKIEWKDERLLCVRCGRRYRMEESWPVLIPEEAENPKAGE